MSTVLQQRATIGSRVGLHARPAALIAQAAARLAADGAQVRIGRAGRDSVDARSPLLLMTLGAAQGDEVVIEASGDRADEVLAEIVALVESDLDAQP